MVCMIGPGTRIRRVCSHIIPSKYVRHRRCSMTSGLLTRLALPAVVGLIAFLSYGPQILFIYIDPGPLGQRQAFLFNAAVIGTWICYLRACFTDPGRVPSEWKPNAVAADQRELARKPRWCRKCNAFKPPRAHHCKTCKRYIERYDSWLILLPLEGLSLTSGLQMHSKDGSSLPLDRELRLLPYLSSFCPLSFLRRRFHDAA